MLYELRWKRKILTRTNRKNVGRCGSTRRRSKSTSIPSNLVEDTEREAASIALAMCETRKTLDHLVETAIGWQKQIYKSEYINAIKEAGVQRVDLVEKFPILHGQFGYTRGDYEPGASRLKTFRKKSGAVVVYGDLSNTEALVFRLDPVRVLFWLRHRGHNVSSSNDPTKSYENILKVIGEDPEKSAVLSDLRVLVHSFSHRIVRQTSYYAGIDRESISELLFPLALTFVTYAVPRGDFVLGGIQAMYEYDLHTVLNRVVYGESRCALDPGCWENERGAACAVCLYLGEPSCRLFNTELDRKILFGSGGYFDFEY